MFRYSSFLDTLLKAMTHKYIRRVPKGVTKTGKTKYMYFYAGQEGHGQGVAHESELVEGASFAFGEHGKTRYHAHISKIDGDKVTVKYDDGAKKGQEETMTKKQFQALVHGEHKESITQARDKSKKQLERFQEMKDKGANVKESTLIKLSSHVQKLQAILDLYTEPAKVEASWMSEKEQKLFEKQNNLFNLLKDDKVLSAVLNTKDTDLNLVPFLINILHATLKYKDISKLTPAQKKDLLSTTALLANTRGFSDQKIKDKVHPLVKTIGELWKNIPYVEQEKTVQKIANMDIISVDMATKSKNSISTKIAHDAIKKSIAKVTSINPELRKIFYGDVFLSNFEDTKLSATHSGGFYVYSNMLNTGSAIDNIVYPSDAININIGTYAHLQALDNVLDTKTMDMLNETVLTTVFTHESTHRFSTDFLQGVYQNSAFRDAITRLKTKMTKKSIDFNKKAIDSYMVPLEAQIRICTSIKNRINANNMLEGLDSDNNSIRINPMDIDYDNLGKSFYDAHTDPQKSNLHIPLKNGKSIVLDNLVSPQLIGSLPSKYASQNIDEFFSEMMVAVTQDNYTTEPYKTDFMNILNTYSSTFGQRR
jgi:hypothetical protein